MSMAFHGPHMGWGFIGGIFPLIFMFIFITIFGVIIYSIVKGIGNSARNSGSPVLTVNAHVVSKRGNMRNDHTWYYATFRFEGGDRMEFPMDGREYGLLAEGDAGRLTFQGTRYMGFQRYSNMGNGPQNG